MMNCDVYGLFKCKFNVGGADESFRRLIEPLFLSERVRLDLMCVINETPKTNLMCFCASIDQRLYQLTYCNHYLMLLFKSRLKESKIILTIIN